jgi:hypothetical protein
MDRASLNCWLAMTLQGVYKDTSINGGSDAEFVDHMDGNKQNNKIENLRIYIVGKQQPGSCPAHGTYYDEWQKALARISELEAQLLSLTQDDRTAPQSQQRSG